MGLFKKQPGKNEVKTIEVNEPSQVNSAPVAPTEPAQQPSVEPAPAKPRKRRLGLFLFLLLLLALLAGLAGYLLSQANKKDTESTSTMQNSTLKTTPKQSQPEDYAKRMVTKVTQSLGVTPTNNTYVPYLPFQQVKGYEFSVSPDRDASASYHGTAAKVREMYAVAKTALTAAGMTATVEPDTGGPGGTTPSLNLADEHLYCGLSALPDNVEVPTLLLACSHKTTYQALATQAQPLWQTYLEAPKESAPPRDGSMGISNVEIKASKTSGYATASAAMGGVHLGGGFEGLFYRTPDEKWHFFKGTQQAIPCIDYNTIEVKKAFLGETCYDTAADKQSTVQ